MKKLALALAAAAALGLSAPAFAAEGGKLAQATTPQPQATQPHAAQPTTPHAKKSAKKMKNPHHMTRRVRHRPDLRGHQNQSSHHTAHKKIAS